MFVAYESVKRCRRPSHGRTHTTDCCAINQYLECRVAVATFRRGVEKDGGQGALPDGLQQTQTALWSHGRTGAWRLLLLAQ